MVKGGAAGVRYDWHRSKEQSIRKLKFVARALGENYARHGQMFLRQVRDDMVPLGAEKQSDTFLRG